MTIYPKIFFEDLVVEPVQGSCFILMPFGEPFDELYQEVIKECLQENNFSINRADELYGSKPIIEDILKNIESSEIIIADVTGKNANVFYELGITHTRKSNDNVIIIAQDINDVPFDLRPYRIILYKPTITGARILKKQLSRTLRGVRLKPFEWMKYKWKPISPTWYEIDDNTLKGEIFKPGEIPWVFNKTPFETPKLHISFTALSDGPEVNLMFYTDGKNRFSGYHFWFWKGGTKLRRLEDEVMLETQYKLKKNFPHDIEVNYDEGNISAVIDKKEVLKFSDTQPLHVKKGLKFIGFNIASVKGYVHFFDLKINSTSGKRKTGRYGQKAKNR